MTQQLTTVNSLPDLTKYGLVWDCEKDFISTFCKSKTISNKVVKAMQTAGLKPHQMQADERIIVLYF